MKVNGKMIKEKEKVFIIILMEINMKVTGKMIIETEKVFDGAVDRGDELFLHAGESVDGRFLQFLPKGFREIRHFVEGDAAFQKGGDLRGAEFFLAEREDEGGQLFGVHGI